MITANNFIKNTAAVAIAILRTISHSLDAARNLRWAEMVENINFKHSSKVAWDLLSKLTEASSKSYQKRGVSAN